jgi:hypothetical protein
MGADPFTVVAFGGTAQDAFRAAVEDAAFWHGHGGYTGTIAEKDSFRTFEVPALTGAPDEAVQAWVTGVMSWQPEDPEMRRADAGDRGRREAGPGTGGRADRRAGRRCGGRGDAPAMTEQEARDTLMAAGAARAADVTSKLAGCPPSAVHDMIVHCDEVREGDLALIGCALEAVESASTTPLPDRPGNITRIGYRVFVKEYRPFDYIAVRRYLTEEG